MKTALITGASSGIGRALAEEFAKKGINLILVARRTVLLEELATNLINRYQVQAKFYSCDLTDTNGIDELVLKLVEGQTKVNYLVNNAGIGIHGEFTAIKQSEITKMLQLNIIALTYLTKCYLEKLADPKGSKILNVASTAAFQPCPYLAVYAATKAYVLSFSGALAVELKKSHITVTVLCPGETETEFISLSGLDKVNRVKKEQMPTPQEVAIFGFEQLQRGRQLAIYGWKNRLMIFGQRFTPRKIVAKIAANLYR